VGVAEEPGLNAFDVCRTCGTCSTANRVDHRRRDVDGDDPLADARRRHGERAGAGPEVDQGAVRVEAVSAKRLQIAGGIEGRLPVVRGDTGRVEVLRAC
jgi:hypothetical protein